MMGKRGLFGGVFSGLYRYTIDYHLQGFRNLDGVLTLHLCFFMMFFSRVFHEHRTRDWKCFFHGAKF